jgi:hypothetical protein
MELAIISLSENLEVLQKELEQESNQLLEISNQLEEKYLETAIEQIDISKRN